VDKEQMTQYVIEQLGKHSNPDDIIRTLAETGKMNWYTAKQFVYEVRANNTGQIARKQAPTLIVMSVVSIIVGAALAIGMAIATLQGWIIFLLTLPIPWLGNVVYFLMGMGMCIGGIAGLLNTVDKSLS
jgi:hypothetical protein